MLYPNVRQHLCPIHPRRDDVNPDMIRDQIRRQHLHQMRGGRLTRWVRKPGTDLSRESCNTGRGNELAHDLRHALLIRRAVRRSVARVEQRQERNERVEYTRGIHVECLGEVFRGHAPEVLLYLGDRGYGGSGKRDARAGDAGVGDYGIDVADFGLDM